MSFVISSTEDTSVKNFLTDSLLLQFTPTGVIADNQIIYYLLAKIFTCRKVDIDKKFEEFSQVIQKKIDNMNCHFSFASSFMGSLSQA